MAAFVWSMRGGLIENKFKLFDMFNCDILIVIYDINDEMNDIN